MELLCIQTHSQGVVIAGEVYPLISEIKSPCECDKTLVNVGISSKYDTSECTICKKVWVSDDIFWINKKLFAQIATEDEVKQSQEMIISS